MINFILKNKTIPEEKKQSLLQQQELIYLANGSPKRLLNNFYVWNEIPEKIKQKINDPLKKYIDIFYLAMDITEELDEAQQEFLVDFIQYIWWKKTNNIYIAKKLEILKRNLNDKLQPRLCWEVNLLEIAMRDIK